MKKRIAILLAALLLVGLLPYTAVSVSSDEKTNGLVETVYAEGGSGSSLPANPCNGSHTGWTAIDSVEGLKNLEEGGKGYLTANVALNQTDNTTWEPKNNVVLCLNGHSIVQNWRDRVIKVDTDVTFDLTDCKTNGECGKIMRSATVIDHFFGVQVYGTLNMYGGCITGNTSGYGDGTSATPGYGGGVHVDSAATFNMYGGTISGNTAAKGGKGGGVYVDSGAAFTMSGGTISGNTADYGGGVYISGDGKFTMSGGTIGGTGTDKNTAKYGGGVYVGRYTDGDDIAHNGEFEMSGGSIVGNVTSQTEDGGGVYVNGTFAMSGGTIGGTGDAKNTAYRGGGVYMGSGSTFTMSDTAEVVGNAATYGGGVYMKGGTFDLNGGSIVSNNGSTNSGGVFVYQEDTAFNVSGSPVVRNNTSSGVKNVNLDERPNYSKYAVVNVTGSLVEDAYIEINYPTSGLESRIIGVAGAAYKLDGNVLKAGAGTVVPGTTPITDALVPMTDLTGKTYTGSAIEPTFGGTLIRGTDYTVTYAVKAGSKGALDGTGKPMNAGTYVVTVTGAGNYTDSFTKEFVIDKATQEAPVNLGTVAPSVENGSGEIGGTAKGMEYAVANASADDWTACDDSGCIVVAPGKYYVRWEGDDNHHASPVTEVTVPGYTANVISVTGVSLNKSETTIAVGSSETLRAVIAPANASNTAVSWESGDGDVALVSEGVVKALKAGETIITVKTADGGFAATCTVTVTDSSSGGDPTPVTPSTGGYYYAGPTVTAVLNGPDAKSATDYSGGIYGLIFRSTAGFSGFRGVQVDGKTIAAANYTAEDNGGIEVYLKAVYLQTLAAGKHTLTILSAAGDVTAEFTVNGGNSSPKTFDAGVGIYAVSAVLSLTGMAWVGKKKF